MFDIGRQVGLPLGYYINNGNLAEQVMRLVALSEGDLPELTISNIKELALMHEQSFAGQPTFARALIELIEKIDTRPADKLNLISDIAKITIALKGLKLAST